MKRLKLFFLIVIIIFVIILYIPQQLIIPVKDATANSWNKKSFWYYPWGKSVTHKGIDIFAKKGTDIYSCSDGVVIFKGNLSQGGLCIAVLGPQWRIYYYAHLNEISVKDRVIKQGTKIGTVGTTGNAKGKEPHLHFTIVTIAPHFWKADTGPHGFYKMFYLNPGEYLPAK